MKPISEPPQDPPGVSFRAKREIPWVPRDPSALVGMTGTVPWRFPPPIFRKRPVNRILPLGVRGTDILVMEGGWIHGKSGEKNVQTEGDGLAAAV
jgi:hypothetical protein